MRTKRAPVTFVEHLCQGWLLICLGFWLGAKTVIYLSMNNGYKPPFAVSYWMAIFSFVWLPGILPYAVLEIVRQIRKHPTYPPK